MEIYRPAKSGKIITFIPNSGFWGLPVNMLFVFIIDGWTRIATSLANIGETISFTTTLLKQIKYGWHFCYNPKRSINMPI